MPKQFEHDVSASIAGLCEALQTTGEFSGGRIDNFRSGVAIYIWGRTKKAHRWVRMDIETVKSACGIEKPALWTTPSGERHSTMYGAGDIPRCTRCDNHKSIKAMEQASVTYAKALERLAKR